MAILKWVGYLALLFSFIWFVFFRGSAFKGFSGFNKTNIENTKANNSGELTDDDEIDAALIDDENAFIDEEINDLEAGDNTSEGGSIADSETAVSDLDNDLNNPSNSSTAGGESTNSIIDLDKKFYVIVGSFGQIANAERMLKRVKDSGKQGVIAKINGLHRVITATTDSNLDARNLRDYFTTIYKETAFVMER